MQTKMQTKNKNKKMQKNKCKQNAKKNVSYHFTPTRMTITFNIHKITSMDEDISSHTLLVEIHNGADCRKQSGVSSES